MTNGKNQGSQQKRDIVGPAQEQVVTPLGQKKNQTERFDAHLGQALRDYYQAVVEEPVPEHLLDLLDSLTISQKDRSEADDSEKTS
jgi:Anti-sigma factor NepR